MTVAVGMKSSVSIMLHIALNATNTFLQVLILAYSETALVESLLVPRLYPLYRKDFVTLCDEFSLILLTTRLLIPITLTIPLIFLLYFILLTVNFELLIVKYRGLEQL